MNLKNYINELKNLKNLLDEDEKGEVDELIETIQSLENIENKPKQMDPSKTQIKFVNTSDNPDPVWAKEGDSGFDLRANLESKEVVLQPFERMLIPTGLYFELPYGNELQIRPRSGHSFKTGLMAILGTVDTGYRGEVKVIMVNLNNTPQKIEHGERIAQGVVASRISTEFGQLIKLYSIDNLSKSERGTGGFGSTGKN